MRDLEENKSKRGVTCHQCKIWIRPGLIYYQHHYQSFNIPKYINYCIKCAKKSLEEGIKSAKRDLEQINILLPIYDEETKIICDKCKNKYKHLVGDCDPTKNGCRPKIVKAFIH